MPRGGGRWRRRLTTVQDARIQQAINDFGLEGRRLYLPQMPYGGSYLLAAAIRSIGFDAWPTSDSDERTLDLGGRVTSGDECYPQKITLGDFLRIIEDEGRDNVAFLMPTANGPCRFGQYLHLIRAKFDELGYDDVPVISITSNDGYSSIGEYSQDLVRTAWRAVLAAGHPHEDAAQDAALRAREGHDRRGLPGEPRGRLAEAVSLRGRLAQGAPGGVVAGHAARPRAVPRRSPADYDAARPLIGVVGEIFCRQNTFSNFDLIRVVEEQGGECWLSDIGEWVWYTDDEQRRRLIEERQAVRQGQRHPLHQEQGHAQRTSTPCRALRRGLRRATKSRTTCATCSR